ncbi:hypothetical protein VSQ48_25055, partial [Candidatus Ventrimonas sp. KK005]
MKSIAPLRVLEHSKRCEKCFGEHFSQWQLPLLCPYIIIYVGVLDKIYLWARGLFVVHKSQQGVRGGSL